MRAIVALAMFAIIFSGEPMSGADRVVNSIAGGGWGYSLWTIADTVGGRPVAWAVVAGVMAAGVAVIVWREDLQRERAGFYDHRT